MSNDINISNKAESLCFNDTLVITKAILRVQEIKCCTKNFPLNI